MGALTETPAGAAPTPATAKFAARHVGPRFTLRSLVLFGASPQTPLPRRCDPSGLSGGCVRNYDMSRLTTTTNIQSLSRALRAAAACHRERLSLLFPTSIFPPSKPFKPSENICTGADPGATTPPATCPCLLVLLRPSRDAPCFTPPQLEPGSAHAETCAQPSAGLATPVPRPSIAATCAPRDAPAASGGASGVIMSTSH